MKRIVIITLASLFASAAGAQLYKWVDKDGRTVYSDQPPAGVDSKLVNTPSSSASSKSFVERDKEMEKLRAKSREEAKKADEKEKTAAAQDERCRQANERLRSLVEGGRIYKYNDKGEREIMVDEEIESERGKAQKLVDEACKKS